MRISLLVTAFVVACENRPPNNVRAADSTSAAAEWFVAKDTNAVDGSIRSTMMLTALPPHDKNPGAITMLVGCGRTRPMVSVIPGVSPEGLSQAVRYRFDSDSIQAEVWSNAAGALTNMRAQKFLSRMASAKRLAFEGGGTGESATFDVSGFRMQTAGADPPCELAR